MDKMICGIQQIGIGVSNVYDAWKWYRQAFGVNVRIFEDNGTAELMLPYTGGKPQNRHAVLAINMQGGGGFEIWQYTTRKPVAIDFEIQLGDLGIFAAKIKTNDVKEAHNHLQTVDCKSISAICTSPSGAKHFWISDIYGNNFQIVENNSLFTKTKSATGGVCGCIIGVSDIDKSKILWQKILGYDNIVYDKKGKFEDLTTIKGEKNEYRRMLLTHSQERKGAFSKMFGTTEIELVQVLDRKPRKMFENRFWGDLGFIHLCFDVVNADKLKNDCESMGYPFTVDTGSSFDMGAAAGRFSYIEDNDGTLIEFVETFKVPVMKKLGIFFDLRKRNPEKPLPDFLIKLLGINKVK